MPPTQTLAGYHSGVITNIIHSHFLVASTLSISTYVSFFVCWKQAFSISRERNSGKSVKCVCTLTNDGEPEVKIHQILSTFLKFFLLAFSPLSA